MRVDAQFREFLDKTLKNTGMSQSALAREIGVKRSTVNHWLKGADCHMRPEHWNRLQAELDKILGAQNEMRRYRPVGASLPVFSQPVVGLEALSGFLSIFDDLQGLRKNAKDQVMCETAGTNMFVFRLADDDMAPLFPRDTPVLVKTDASSLQNGSLCLFKIRDKNESHIICRLWYATDASIELRAIKENATTWRWPKSEREAYCQAIAWCYPVVEIAERLKWA